VFIEEVDRTGRPITGAGTAVTGFMGVAERGPLATPIRLFSYDDYKRVYGNPLEYQALAYAVKGFFEEGGVECHVSRLAHYTDIADINTWLGDVAGLDFDGIGVDTAAIFTGSATLTTLNLLALIYAGAGMTLDIDVNNVGVASVEIVAAQASETLGAGIVLGSPLSAPRIMTVSVDGGPTQTITFTNGVDDVSVAAALAKLNTVEGARWSDGLAALTVTSDTYGTNSSFELLTIDAELGTFLGLAPGSVTEATSSMADASAMTFAELKTLLEATLKTATPGDLITLTQNATGKLVLTTVLTGAAAEIDLQGTSTAGLVTLLGLTGLGTQDAGAAAGGSDSGAVPALNIQAGYKGYPSPGTFGNGLDVGIAHDPKFSSSGVGLDLAVAATAGDTQVQLTSVTGIGKESILRLVDGATVEYAKVQSVTTSVTGAGVTHVVTLYTALTNSFTLGTTAVDSMEFTVTIEEDGIELESPWKQLSSNPDADNYAVTVLNDSETGSNYVMATDLGIPFPGNIPAASSGVQPLVGGTAEALGLVNGDLVGDSGAKTGVYAFDEVESISLLAAPPTFGSPPGGTPTISANAVVHTALVTYCASRQDLFAILDGPEGLTPAQMVAYRNNTLGIDNKYGAIYYPFIKVPDPLGTGNNPVVSIPPSGNLAGLYSRVDSITPPDGGIASAPAGQGDFGKLRGVVGLAVGVGDADHDILNPANVNAIRNFKLGTPAQRGVMVMGARTLSTDPRWRYIQVRRLFTYVEQSIKRSLGFSLFRNNDFRLWAQLKKRIERFLRSLHQDGQLAGEKAEDAYYVKVGLNETMSQTDIDEGRLILEIGLAAQKPAEFIITQYTQTQAGTTVTEA